MDAGTFGQVAVIILTYKETFLQNLQPTYNNDLQFELQRKWAQSPKV